jgi:DNA-binding response OmpR family regulator
LRILLVEDEAELANLILRNVGAKGFAIDRVKTVAEARDAAGAAPYALVLLDRRLPDGDGLSAIPDLRRAHPAIPIIILTALDAIDARVAGLDGGADDYLVKPFALDELLARMRAALRRPGGVPPPPVICGRLTFEPMERVVRAGGAPVTLSRRELALLEALILRAGRVVPRAALIEQVYNFDDEIQENTFDALVARLRRRCAELNAGVTIHTVRGLGYILRGDAA